MKKRMFIIAGLMLLSILHVQAQIAENMVITLNNDNSPIEAVTNKGDLVVTLNASDVVNFDFKKFSGSSENVTIEITNQRKDETILSRKTNGLKLKNKFDLKISELDFPSESENEVYLVSLTNGIERQLVFRFKKNG